MNKISSRDIRVLVAGALALTGFRALIWLPYYFTLPMSVPAIGGAVLTGLALPIGIGIFLKRPMAIAWAQIYLWFVVISGGIALPFFWEFLPQKVGRFVMDVAPEMLVSAVLLGLIFWSNSEKFKHEPEAVQSAATDSREPRI